MSKKNDPRLAYVESRLQEAARTLNNLPINVFPPKYKCILGGMIASSYSTRDMDGDSLIKIPPAPEEIDAMDEVVLKWLPKMALTPHGKNKTQLLWARANKLPWKLIQVKYGYSRAYANQFYNKYLNELADMVGVRHV